MLAEEVPDAVAICHECRSQYIEWRTMTGTLEFSEYQGLGPAENLAWDEVLLEQRKEALRLWESPVPFIVLGRSGRIEREVRLPVEMPVLRRTSGGGTVLQGPGCLNYSLVLSLECRPELTSVERSYAVLQGWVVRVLGMALEVRGSDILFDGRKVSGSAQRRTRGWLLHHGTLLYDTFDLGMIERVLREPERQPAHREGRRHGEFVGKLPVGRAELRHRLSSR